MLRPLVLRAGLAGLMLAFLAAAAFAASGDRKDIVLRGLVSDGAGRPVASASVSASGPLEFSTIANATGHYVLTIHVGTLGALVRQPITFLIEAKDGGARVPVEGGPAKLELKLMALADSLGQPRVEARSNFQALDLQLNFGLRQPGDGVVPAALNFSRHKGGAVPAPVPAASPAAPAPAAALGATAAPRTPPTNAAPPPSTRGSAPAPASIVAPPVAAAAPPDKKRRTKKKEPATAMELLEASRQQGSIFAAGPVLDSLTGRFPSDAPKLAGSDGTRSMERMLDSLSRAAKQEAKRRHSFTRDSVRAAERANADGGKHGFQRDAAAAEAAAGAAGASAGSHSSAKFAGPSRDSAEEQARRDSVKIAQRSKESEREAAHRLTLERESMRHDSTLAALRMRDSLRAVTRVWEGARAAQRRDSLKAAKPAPPTLDRRPPVAGRVPGDPADPDTCRCRIRGTIETRTDRPLSSPLHVTVSVRGVAALASRVRLDMGSPREFTFERVPCGQRVLDVAIDGGRRFTMLTPDELKANCVAGRLIQPRIAIRPN